MPITAARRLLAAGRLFVRRGTIPTAAASHRMGRHLFVGGMAIGTASAVSFTPVHAEEASNYAAAAAAAAAVGLVAAAYYTIPAGIQMEDGKNAAFVFLKPHACTDPAKALVATGLKDKGFKILAEGELTGDVIDAKMYIDQHYYSIASKATILEPNQLNVPSDKFEAQFGLSWEDALAQGNVYNAKQAKAKLGCNDDELDAKWAKAKKAKDLVKFGGGFYCGLVDGLYVFNGFFMSMRSKFVLCLCSPVGGFGLMKHCCFVALMHWMQVYRLRQDLLLRRRVGYEGLFLGRFPRSSARPHRSDRCTTGQPPRQDCSTVGFPRPADPMRCWRQRCPCLCLSVRGTGGARELA